MSELGPSSFELSDPYRPMDVPGRVADMPSSSQELYGSNGPNQTSAHAGEALDGWIDMGGDEPIPSQYTNDPREPIDMGGDEPHPSQYTNDPVELIDMGFDDYGQVEKRNTPESETQATTEVLRAMADIETAEQQIAEHTGLTGEALADATDDYLVDKVKHKQLAETPDTTEALEDALIEGALEAVGDRPVAQDNPILHLERDGLDTQITKGVEHLREQDARLPNGESAAEVVAATLAESESVQHAARAEQQSDSLELALHYYTQGSSKEDLQRYTGIDPSVIANHIRNLPKEQQEHYKMLRQEASFAEEAKQKLTSSSPELFEGRVSAEFEAMLHEAGYDSYAVGFNQHDAISDWSEAAEYLAENGGVEMVGYGPNQRFLIHDSESPSEDYPMGYYSAKVGRFVYAFPVEAGAENAPRFAASVGEGVPADTFIPNAVGDEVANIRYCVGFIDGDQVFHANEKFMTKTEERSETMDYDKESKEAGWDSPERAQKLVEKYIVPGAQVLDIGIGTGQAVKGYAEKGAVVVGLDHDETMLANARQVIGDNGELRVADINKTLPIGDLAGQVDVVQAVGVLEFANDLDGVFTQVNAAQINGGSFVFTTETLGDFGAQAEPVTAYPEAGVVVHRHTVDEINKLLVKNGYTLLNYDSYGAYDRDGGKVPYTIFLAKKFREA